MPSRRASAVLAVTSALIVLLPSAALANMAPPVAPGDAVGEPAGELGQIHIVRETLEIDLRPLVDAAPVDVTATYQLRNEGDARFIELVFVAAGLGDEAHGVWLDGRPVAYQTEQVNAFEPPADIPWRPPADTPGLAGGTISYSARYEGLLRFTLELPPGEHEIRVSYPAQATAFSGDSPARYWQLGYVLSPARQWASFGTLDVLVRIPDGWSFASSPSLERSGSEARGSFNGVPADSIGITAQVGFVESEAIVLPLIGTGAAAGIVLAALLGVLFGRRRWRPLNAWPLLLAYSVGAAFVTVFMGRALVGGGQSVPESQRNWNAYQGMVDALAGGLQMIILFPLVAVVVFLVMQAVLVFVARRSARGRAPGQSPAG